MKSINSKKAGEYDQKINKTEEIINEKINTEPPANLPSKDHAIVILGYALAEDGTMKPTLVENLLRTSGIWQYPELQR